MYWCWCWLVVGWIGCSGLSWFSCVFCVSGCWFMYLVMCLLNVSFGVRFVLCLKLWLMML